MIVEQDIDGKTTVLLSGLTKPTGIALNRKGTLLYGMEVPMPGVGGAAGGLNKVWELNLRTKVKTLVNSGDPEPTDVTVDRPPSHPSARGRRCSRAFSPSCAGSVPTLYSGRLPHHRRRAWYFRPVKQGAFSIERDAGGLGQAAQKDGRFSVDVLLDDHARAFARPINVAAFPGRNVGRLGIAGVEHFRVFSVESGHRVFPASRTADPRASGVG